MKCIEGSTTSISHCVIFRCCHLDFYPLPHADYLANLQVSISYTEKRGLRFLKTNLTLDWLHVLFIEQNYLFTLLKIKFKQWKNSVSCDRTLSCYYMFLENRSCPWSYADKTSPLLHVYWSTHMTHSTAVPHPLQNIFKFETLTKTNTRQLDSCWPHISMFYVRDNAVFRNYGLRKIPDYILMGLPLRILNSMVSTLSRHAGYFFFWT